MWNEPKFNRFRTSTEEDFLTLIEAAVDTLNRVAPDTIVLVGSLILHTVRNGSPLPRRFSASRAAERVLSENFFGVAYHH